MFAHCLSGAGLDLESGAFTECLCCAKCKDFQMHNTRKLEEMSDFEERPQRRLLSTEDIAKCVCLYSLESVCVRHPLCGWSFLTNFIGGILRGEAGLCQRVLKCPAWHIWQVLGSKTKIQKQQNLKRENKKSFLIFTSQRRVVMGWFHAVGTACGKMVQQCK